MNDETERHAVAKFIKGMFFKLLGKATSWLVVAPFVVCVRERDGARFSRSCLKLEKGLFYSLFSIYCSAL